ncbi:translation elongation factor-like protein [Candidatus Woesearchaeota archaeon CG10_big_fil_rev_8_21_14_0_10_44_13]|nr:MAG: translation elongation factor-like protein [Candidatus Woesearchaeota archaeon CG10_big_fil_rev_8_21_14_0_10_44_13]
MQRTKIGEVTHFYSHISVAVVKIENSLKAGDVISIEGATTNLKQKVESMQIDHDKVTEAKKGQEIGMKVIDKVREGDIVYKA